MKLLYGGYRDWAFKAYRNFIFSPPQVTQRFDSSIVFNQEQLLSQINLIKPDITFLAGWSWIIPPEICQKHYIVGLHPSDLPDYAGGTPIQHQIIDGLTKTKATLFRITPQLDAGGILMKTDLSLEGNMTDVFNNLSVATEKLLVQLVSQWPNVTETTQHVIKPRRRIKPDESRLTASHLSAMSARSLYNFMRCREDPYPNVFVEDKTGKLLIKLVDFEPK